MALLWEDPAIWCFTAETVKIDQHCGRAAVEPLLWGWGREGL